MSFDVDASLRMWHDLIMNTIRKGSVGESVASWQGVIGVKQDGIFGNQTEAETKAWQLRKGLQPDGVVGLLSWRAAGMILAPSDPVPLIRGIDACPFQGEITEATWKLLGDQGVRFVIFRMLVGNESWSDIAYVKKNVARARAIGIACGAYLFPYPLPKLDYKAQVERFVKLLDGLGMEIGDIPPSYDMEWPPKAKRNKDGSLEDTWGKHGCSASQLRDWNLSAIEYGEKLTGVSWIVYSYRYWLASIEAHKSPEFGERKLWLADYKYGGIIPTSEQVAKLKPPAPWSKITILQHDGDGGLKLPSGADADFNVMLGGEDTLKDLTGQSATPIALGDRDISSLGLASIVDASDLVTESELASYRKERVDSEV
jgi:hypothetical protein